MGPYSQNIRFLPAMPVVYLKAAVHIAAKGNVPAGTFLRKCSVEHSSRAAALPDHAGLAAATTQVLVARLA